MISSAIVLAPEDENTPSAVAGAKLGMHRNRKGVLKVDIVYCCSVRLDI